MTAERSAELAREPERLRDALIALDPVAAARTTEIRVVHAPGRVNLIGDHTDYNEGFALPSAIDLGISIALVPADDARVSLTLVDTAETGTFALDAPLVRQGGWLDYVRGMAWALQGGGARVTGFRGLLASDLPQGAGLSSSAAIELASGWALCGGEAPSMSTLELVKVVQRAENGFIGLNNGLMDRVRLGVRGGRRCAPARLPGAHPPGDRPAGGRVARRLSLGIAAEARELGLQRTAFPVRGRRRRDPAGRPVRHLAPGRDRRAA